MRRIYTALVPVLLVLTAGCNAYRLDPPAGFAEVDKGSYGAHMKANDNVGLRVNVFDNVAGGTLTFWSRDMVEKLGRRGYTLTSQSAAKSANGVAGTRFDFDYTPVGEDQSPRFYTAVLFVSDEYMVVLQVAGGKEHRARYTAEIDAVVGELKVRGCKVITKACKGPQPEQLATVAPAPAPSAEADAPPAAAATEAAGTTPTDSPSKTESTKPAAGEG
ncbi:MAG: hypothetical protein K0V04_11640 [Deltaproteobacteria bacterium]|nr:hypothetical protein [Deltaproteobacteria bacterium]